MSEVKQELSLPTSRNVKDTRYCSQRIAILGKSGRGKTSTLTGDPGHLIIDMEQGATLYEGCYVIQANSMSDVRKIVGLLQKKADDKSEPFPYTGVYYDTLDKLVEFAEKETLVKAKYDALEFNKTEKGRKNPVDPKKIVDMFTVPGQLFNGWNYRTGLAMSALEALNNLPCAKGFVGHIKTYKEEDDAGVEHDITGLNIGGALGVAALAWTYHTLFIHGVRVGDKLKRWIRTRPSATLECKSRDNLIPDMLEFPEGNTNEQNWQLIRKCFT